jgi:hypothetical protein
MPYTSTIRYRSEPVDGPVRHVARAVRVAIVSQSFPKSLIAFESVWTLSYYFGIMLIKNQHFTEIVGTLECDT